MTTPTQGTLDLAASRDARDQGIAKAEMGAQASWLDQAEAVIRAIFKTAVLPRDIDGSMPSSLILVFRPRD